MKAIFKANIIIFLMLLPTFLNAQIVIDKSFRTFHPRIEMSRTKSVFKTGNNILPITQKQKISGLSISGNITFTSEKGFVRILLIDDYEDEYLVLETNTIFENKTSISFEEFCDETALLNNILPKQIKIESTDAQVTVNGIQYSANNEYQTSKRKQVRAEQLDVKLRHINAVLAQKEITWGAGKTSLSEMSYMEKKNLFGGKVPNFAGFDYYVSGIYVMPGYKSNSLSLRSTATSQFVSEFDWRNRHGRNWMTPAKNQGCSDCWAFAAVGTTEAYVNLYYNQLLNLDLSEQDILSCSGGGTCSGGNGGSALNYIKNTGVVNESCFGYAANNLSCSNKCTNPSEKIKIGNSTYFNPSTQTSNDLKKLIVKSPVLFGIDCWWHALVLTGFKTIQAGDQIYIKTDTEDRWVTVVSGNPLIGSNAWILKNSWGTSWGSNGFGYVVTNWSEVYITYSVSGNVTSLSYTNSDIICEDRDGDGYYFWGIGTKPATCPLCALDEPDGDDSNPNLGPMDEYGNCSILSGIQNTTNFINQTVTTNTTVTSCGDIFSQNVVVQNGAKLTFDATGTTTIEKDFEMELGAELEIK